MLKKNSYGLLSFKDSDHLSSNHLINSSILLFNQHDSNPVEEETVIHSSTSNLKICLYKLTTCVRIPLDMKFFYCTRFITAKKVSISISQQLIMAQTMLTGTQKLKAVTRKHIENKTKPLITATGQFRRNHGSFNYAFFSTLCAVIGHFATFEG